MAAHPARYVHRHVSYGRVMHTCTCGWAQVRKDAYHEATMLSSLDHPNIVSYLDMYEDEGMCACVLSDTV